MAWRKGQTGGHVITPKCPHLIQSVCLEAEGTADCQEEEARNVHEDRRASTAAPTRKAGLTEGQALVWTGSVQCCLELTGSHGRMPSTEKDFRKLLPTLKCQDQYGGCCFGNGGPKYGLGRVLSGRPGSVKSTCLSCRLDPQ